MKRPLFPSINHGRSKGKFRGAAWVFWALPLCLSSAPSRASLPDLPQLTFHAESVEYAGRKLDNVAVSVGEGGEFQISFARLHGPEAHYLGSGIGLSGRIEDFAQGDSGVVVAAAVRALGLEGRLSLHTRPEQWRIGVEMHGQPATVLAGLSGMPDELGWISSGDFDLAADLERIQRRPPALTFQVGAKDLTFDSPDGQYAAAGLGFSAHGSIELADDDSAELEGRLEAGELLFLDFYRDFTEAGLAFAFSGVRSPSGLLQIDRIRLDDGGALTMEGAAHVDSSAEPMAWSVEVSRLELAFPLAYRRYLEAVAAVWALDGLEVTGHVSWNGEWASGSLVSGDLVIGDFSIVDVERQRFAVTGFEARLRPGDYTFDSRLHWRGLLLGSINLGAGDARLDSEPGTIALLEPLQLDVLGGRLDLTTLRVVLPGSRADGRGEPDIRMNATIESLDVSELTRALGWPEFGGTVSGEIPGVSMHEGALTVDGEIRFRIFDGLVSLKNLGIERPFGVLPSLAADIDVSNLDLQELTSTFSFGRIAGRLDGHVANLRMLDWKPVAFDAWLGTPERQQGSNDISRQAVNRLTTIGGGSPTTALTSPLMRMFSNFSYRRLGLGCVLQNYVCHLRGLSDDGAGVLILEGAGVPKITIRAFNRDIDWPQMLGNLVAISEGDSIRVGERPDS